MPRRLHGRAICEANADGPEQNERHVGQRALLATGPACVDGSLKPG